MRSEFPGLLYCTGALIAVASWALFMFSKKVHREGRTVSILRLSVIWILFLVSSALALASYPVNVIPKKWFMKPFVKTYLKKNNKSNLFWT